MLLNETFADGSLGGMEAVSYASGNDWKASSYEGRTTAYMNGFGADDVSDDWLVTPALNLPAYDQPSLTFDSYTQYDGGTLSVLISTDYTGDGDPANAAWTPLDDALPHTKAEDGKWLPERQWVSSETIDLSAFGNNIAYLAFRYVSTGTGGGDGPAWNITAIKVTGDRSHLIDSDFNDDTLQAWTSYSLASNKDWEAATGGGEQAAFISGFGADTASDDWLISPALDLDRFASPELVFDQWAKYASGELSVLISTDYDGSGNPLDFEWTDLNLVAHEKDASENWQPYDTWLRDTTQDLTAFTGGTAYLAFRYISFGGGSGQGPDWAIDNVRVTAKDRSLSLQAEDFSSGSLGTWEANDMASSTSWSNREVDGVAAAYMNGFGADAASEDWLISPAIDLGAADAAFVTFDTYVKYGGGDLELFAANDYTGDAATATWQPLGFNRPVDDSQVWTPSGEISLDDFLGETIRLGFKYTSTGTGPGDGAAWYVSNIDTRLLTEATALPLSGGFSASPTSVRSEIDPVSFTASALNGAGAPYTFAWDFGDGNTASGRMVEHTYQTAGRYTVTLTIRDAADNTVEVSKADHITVSQLTQMEIPAKVGQLRIATFNASMSEVGGTTANNLIGALSTPDLEKAQQVAEILQRIRPDVVLLNEFDYDAAGEAARLFQDNYLSVAQAADVEPIDYPYVFLAQSNTGVHSGFDLYNDGSVTSTPGSDDYANDAFGYGRYPGQYGMILLSRLPIQFDQARTFQTFRWIDMPDAALPVVPATGETHYSPEELAVFRLSSKSHWDVPVEVNGEMVHVLASHPTPPVFDDGQRSSLTGEPEFIDWNGLRNHDEIRFWADHIDPAASSYIYDDNGTTGGLPADAAFVIMGDQNASAVEGDATGNPIALLLDHPLVQGDFQPESDGGEENAPDNPYSRSHTANWQMRADYVLPSAAGLSIEQGAVFWPTSNDVFSYLASGSDPSDHRLVWLDLSVGDGSGPVQPPSGDGDVNRDGVIDRTDLDLIRGQLYPNKPDGSCPGCDVDGDGRTTLQDLWRAMQQMR